MQITGGYWNVSVDGHAVWQTQNSLMGEIKEAKMDHLKILHTLHLLCMHYQVNYFNYLFSTFISCLPLIRISLGLKRLWIKSCSCDLPWVDEARNKWIECLFLHFYIRPLICQPRWLIAPETVYGRPQEEHCAARWSGCEDAVGQRSPEHRAAVT